MTTKTISGAGVLMCLAWGCAQGVTAPSTVAVAVDSAGASSANVVVIVRGKPDAFNSTTLSLDRAHWTRWTGSGAKVSLTNDATGALTVAFPVGGPGTIDYLFTKRTPQSFGPAQTLVVDGAIPTTGTPVFHWDDSQGSSCSMPPRATVFFWSHNMGNGEFDRWWAFDAPIILGAGAFSVAVPLDPARWSSVFGARGDQAPEAFASAIGDVAAMGVTFGGGCFFGHGVYVTGGTATWTLTNYEVR